ncbi:Tellurite resistance protein TehA [Rhodococcus triatomae]|uniref:Tellurite resistance protein TehA n=1 Tax=Rhodococcus triatomae TaxID=300028 RepID=A0A1G8FLT4_9NOCA|nr:C4-dicarboxylate ABC transporter [Rhodococcus triatomae]SDH83105.1 Tellurite resistance protein TehA [Rhodococcus triatomae]
MTPNWFASVMGTGIIAVVAAAGPQTTALHVTAEVFWILSATLLLVVGTAHLHRWVGRTDDARADVHDPAMFPFFGAVSMGLLTVGAASGSAGRALLGDHPSVALAAALWTAGTLLGAVTYVEMVRRLRGGYPADPVPAWLMPVVPPMVSAATGAALVAHLDGAARVAFLALCYVLFAAALAAAVAVAVPIARRLHRRGLPRGPVLPTLWIPLGVVGQSVAAANLLGTVSHRGGLHAFGIGYGVVVGSVGVAGIAALTVVTLAAFVRGLDYAPTWWSFTFPLGTCALGATALGAALGSEAIRAFGLVLWGVLCLVWAAVAAATVRSLLAVPANAAGEDGDVPGVRRRFRPVAPTASRR